MKKYLFAFVLMVSTQKIIAQNERRTLYLQPQVGINLANFMDASSSKPRIRFMGGAEIEYFVTDVFSVSLGALYSSQGIKETYRFLPLITENGVMGYDVIPPSQKNTSGNELKMSLAINTNYIKIPAMIKFYVSKSFALNLGIQSAFKVNASYKLSGKYRNQMVDVKGKLSELGFNVKTIDFSIPVGFSCNFYNVTLDARYNISTTKVGNIEYYGMDFDIDSRHSIFQFTLGYKFKLK